MPPMFRCRLIRAPFLLALAFVVGAWATSYFDGFLLYNAAAGNLQGAGAVQGLGFIGVRHDALFPDELLGVDYVRRGTAKGWLGIATTQGFFAATCRPFPIRS
jgi:hypothetical protein